MTYQPPQEPHQPPGAAGPQPAPTGWAPQPARPPIDREKERNKALIIAGVTLTACFWIIVAIFWAGRANSKADKFDVEITSCRATGSVATVGLEVKNIGDEVDSVAVEIEYRGGDGARLDTDTAHIRDVQPGDTVRHDESTILNASPGSALTCRVTDIS